MSYTIIGKRFNHKEMKDMVGKPLYRIVDENLEKAYIIGIRIGETNKWEFVITGNNEHETLFYNPKSAKRYAKKNNIKLKALI